MSWNNIPDNERLRLWKKLRSDLLDLEMQEQLLQIAKFFANIPYGSRTIDYYSPLDWPTPWEIIFHGSLCRSSISLLIFYTFSLLHTEKSIELHLIDDGGEEYLLPVIDNQFVLNYELGKVNSVDNIKDDIKILKIFLEKDIKEIK